VAYCPIQLLVKPIHKYFAVGWLIKLSKLFESGIPETGKSKFHCEALITLFLVFFKVDLFAFNTAAKVEGGCTICKAAFNASRPLSTNSAHTLEKLALAFLDPWLIRLI
jgi:hypothetical protein